jgi:hypothetical protein
LSIPKAQQTSAHAQRLARAMERAGWLRNPAGRVTIDGKPVRGYIRPVNGSSVSRNAPTSNHSPLAVAKDASALGVEGSDGLTDLTSAYREAAAREDITRDVAAGGPVPNSIPSRTTGKC